MVDEAGNLEELTIWRVPKSRQYPEGVRYRLAYILNDTRKPSVLYDNHHPKGHHKHLRESQIAYEFVDIEQLLQDFMHDVRSLE